MHQKSGDDSADTSPDDRTRRGARQLAFGLSCGVIALSVVVLVGGWLLDIDALRRLRPDFAAMVVSTALSFLIGASALLTILWPGGASTRRSATDFVAAGAVALIASVNLITFTLTPASGLDELFLPASRDLQTDSMATATAISFLIAAFCLFRLASRGGGEDPSFTVAATTGLLFALVAVVGYAFDAEALYLVSIFTAMALHTALAFVAFFIAALCVYPARGWVGILTGPGEGSRSARRLFPLVIGVPFVLGLLALGATEIELVSANFRLSALTATIMALLGAAVLRNALYANESERAQAALNEKLRRTLADKELLLREVYHRVKNNLQQVNALLMLEEAKMTDPAAIRAFEATAGRVHALGTVHRMLIAAAVPSEVLVRNFLADLIGRVSSTFGDARRITIECEAPETTLHIDVAISLGLIVNELVANAIEHGFPGDRRGTVNILYEMTEDGGARLTVSDDGIGLADEEKALSGTGSDIVRGMAEQIGAELRVSSEKGLRVTLDIPPAGVKGHQYVG